MTTTVRYGVTLTSSTGANLVDAVVADAREAAEHGVESVWLGQRLDYDSVGLAGIVGREVPGLHVGTAAVPVFGRHPIPVAGQAQTTQAATHGRFHLALALGAAPLAERAFGVPWERPVDRLREFLTALHSVLHTGAVDLDGDLITAHTPMPAGVPGAEPPVPVLVAAMAPRALRVTGELADGAVPFLAAPGVLAEHVVPPLATAAERSGRPTPRVVALVPAVVTDDVDGARDALAGALGFYTQFPSYRRVVELGGTSDPVDVALVGDEETVAAGIRRYVEAGVTEVVLTAHDVAGPEARRRTWALAGHLAG